MEELSATITDISENAKQTASAAEKAGQSVHEAGTFWLVRRASHISPSSFLPTKSTGTPSTEIKQMEDAYPKDLSDRSLLNAFVNTLNTWMVEAKEIATVVRTDRNRAAELIVNECTPALNARRTFRPARSCPQSPRAPQDCPG